MDLLQYVNNAQRNEPKNKRPRMDKRNSNDECESIELRTDSENEVIDLTMTLL